MLYSMLSAIMKPNTSLVSNYFVEISFLRHFRFTFIFDIYICFYFPCDTFFASLVITFVVKFQIKNLHSLLSWRLISLQAFEHRRGPSAEQSHRHSTQWSAVATLHGPIPSNLVKEPKKNRKRHDVSRLDNPSFCDDLHISIYLRHDDKTKCDALSKIARNYQSRNWI